MTRPNFAPGVVCVATDLCAGADAAVAQGDAWAARFGARLVVVHVVDDVVGPDLPGAAAELAAVLRRERLGRASAALAARVAELVCGTARDVELHVRCGDPATEVLRVAGATGAELVVVGAGDEPQVRALAVARRVIDRAGVPVLVARPRRATNVTVAASDFTDPRLPALHVAARRASDGGRLVLFDAAPGEDPARADGERTRAVELDRSLTRLAAAARTVDARFAERRASTRDPRGCILAAVDDLHADLVVVGARRASVDGAWERVASPVARDARCSVLVVPLSGVDGEE